MTKLSDLATLVRSKNAGPFMLTIDIMFDTPDVYRRVRESKVIDHQLIATIYSLQPEVVDIYEVDAALAIKVSFPRPAIQGSIEDTDMHGGQQFAPLLDVQIP
jgi:hypothetical protein